MSTRIDILKIFAITLFFIPMASVFAVSELSYCLNGSSLFYDTYEGVVFVDLSKKLEKKVMRIPDLVNSKLRKDSSISILECKNDKLLIHRRGGESFEFQIHQNKELMYIKSHPNTGNLKFKSLGALASKTGDELYRNDKFKVILNIVHSENATITSFGSSIIHSYRNILVKIDLKTGKEIDKLEVYKGDREETVD